MFNKYLSIIITTLVVLFVGYGQTLHAQGVTSGSIEGLVVDIQGETLPGQILLPFTFQPEHNMERQRGQTDDIQ